MLLALALWAGAVPVLAQDTLQISGHGLTLGVKANHLLASQAVPALRYQAKPLIQKMGLWITTGDNVSRAAGAVCDVYSGAADFWPGPAGLSGGASGDTALYNKVYQLRAVEVQRHRATWKQPGYEPAANIAAWPANGAKGFASVLAPYADLNRNGVYEPEKGDYPFVPEGELAYCISNDAAGSGRITASGSLGAEVQSMLWIPTEQTDTALGLLAYLRFVVHNRSRNHWHGVALSLAVDFALGDANDDYLITDVNAGGIAAYNGAATDAVFGTDIPAVTVYMLNRQLLSTMYFENTADAVRGKPTTIAHYHHLARGRWKTGRNLAYGRAGLDGNILTSYVYSNGTDPTNSGIWNEGDAGNFPGNRTGLLTADTFSLPAGGSTVLEFALGLLTRVGNDPAALGTKMNQQKNAAIRQQNNPLPGLYVNPIEMRLMEHQMIIRGTGNSVLNVSVYDMTARPLAEFCFLGGGIVNLKNLPGNGPVVFMVSDEYGRQVRGKAMIPEK
jgi:hypothetical protein